MHGNANFAIRNLSFAIYNPIEFRGIILARDLVVRSFVYFYFYFSFFLLLPLLFSFFPFFFRRRWREGRPPLFMGTSDSS